MNNFFFVVSLLFDVFSTTMFKFFALQHSLYFFHYFSACLLFLLWFYFEKLCDLCGKERVRYGAFTLELRYSTCWFNLDKNWILRAEAFDLALNFKWFLTPRLRWLISYRKIVGNQQRSLHTHKNSNINLKHKCTMCDNPSHLSSKMISVMSNSFDLGRNCAPRFLSTTVHLLNVFIYISIVCLSDCFQSVFQLFFIFLCTLFLDCFVFLCFFSCSSM